MSSNRVQAQASSVQSVGYGARMPIDPAVVIPEREVVWRPLVGAPETMRLPLLLSMVGGFSISETARIPPATGGTSASASHKRKAFRQCYTQESSDVAHVAQTDQRKSSKMEERPVVTWMVSEITPASY